MRSRTASIIDVPKAPLYKAIPAQDEPPFFDLSEAGEEGIIRRECAESKASSVLLSQDDGERSKIQGEIPTCLYTLQELRHRYS